MIMIIDDDIAVAEVASAVLTQAGCVCSIADHTGDLISQIKAATPTVVVVDIMMPQVDGLELCRQVKTNQDLSGTKVIILSGKAYDFDKRRAREMGADGYVVKPIVPDAFVKTVLEAAAGTFTVKYWGVRGTLPVPGPDSLKYGGNTPCVTMHFPNDQTFVFDAGSGIKALSTELMSSRKGKIDASLFISHPHWDHINAFPFFAPFFIPGNHFTVYGASQGDKSIEDLVSAQMDDVYFPIMLRDMGASIKFKTLGEETIEAGTGITVKTMLLSHPGNCLGYRVTFDGKSVCYITDNELYLKDSPFFNGEYEDKLAEFVSGCDILITDTTYFDEEYPTKVHWGHSPVSRVLDLAANGAVKSLHLFHHDPDQTDDDIDRKLDVATEKMNMLAPAISVAAPAEGMSYNL